MPGMSDAELERLLREGVDREGTLLEINWGLDHSPPALTGDEIGAVIANTRALAGHRER